MSKREEHPGMERTIWQRMRTGFRQEKYAGMALYFWHGMRFGAWYNLLKKNDFRITWNCLPQIISTSLVTPINSLLYRIQEAVYAKRLKDYEIEHPPLFVLGHWRTGTTYLHELLACDPEFGYPSTYDCIFPSHFLLSGPVARFGFGLVQPKKRPMDDVAVGSDKPQEEEFALCIFGLPSAYTAWALPRRGPAPSSHVDLRDLPAEDKRRWKEGFLWFLRRVSYRCRKPLILKTPQNTARVATLLEMFPDARFIHIARDPITVFPSTMRTWKSMNSIQGLEHPPHDDPWLEDYVLDTFSLLFERYEEDRELIPEGHLTEITYEELVADPKAVLKSIYAKLDLGDFSRAEPAIENYLSGTKEYQTNKYELPEEKQNLIRQRWAPYFKRFGYDVKATASK